MAIYGNDCKKENFNLKVTISMVFYSDETTINIILLLLKI